MAQRTRMYIPKNKHGTWKYSLERNIYKPPFVLVSMFVFRCGSHVFIASESYFVAARPAKTISIFFFQVWSFLMIYLLLWGPYWVQIYLYIYIHDIIDIHDKSTLRQFARWQVSKTHGCLAKPEVYWPEIQTKKWANLWDSVGASMTVHVASCNMCWKYYAATCSVCLIFLQTHTHTRCYGWCTAFAQLVII